MRKLSRRIAAVAAVIAGCALNNASAQWAVNGTHIYNTNTGKVGIGIGATTPFGQLTVKGSGGVPASAWVNAGAPLFTGFGENLAGNSDYILAMASNIVGARPVFIGRRSRGTLAAPTVVVNNDQISSYLVSGYDGSSFQNPAAIDFFVDGVPSAGNVPARISFVTGTNGSNRAERLKILSNGDVSITTGNAFLTKGNFNMGSAAKTIQFALPDSGNTGMMTMFPSGTSNIDRMVLQHSPSYPTWGLQYQDASDRFNFLSGGVPVFTTDLAYQRVGILTSTPGVRLDVAGSGSYDLTSGGDFRLGNASYNVKMGVALAGGGAGDAYIASSNRLYLGTSNSLGNSQLMSINSNARVGIGTFTPSARFHVKGDTASTLPVILAEVNYIQGNSDVRAIQANGKVSDGYGYGVQGTGGYRGGYFFGDGGSYTGGVYGAYGYATGDSGTRAGIYGQAAGTGVGVRYGVYGTATGGADAWGGYFPVKTYTNELRVGGTAGATGYVAAINGKLIATEVRVEALANWPDYVFGTNHKLLPIEDLEASINANKHLPGVPSAAEVKENGIMLGDMQTKAMEKIEEATLYIIQLNNKIKELEKKIDELNKH